MKRFDRKYPMTAPQRGFSLVEFMIAITLGLLMMAGVATIVVSGTQSRNELEKASRQIENGRFAIQTLSEDIQLAGFYGDYVPSSVTWTTPDPCTLALQDMGFAPASYTDLHTDVVNGTTATNLPIGIHGYANGVSPPASCNSYVTNRKSGTDILVIRRVSTNPVTTDSDENGTVDAGVDALDGGYYLQVSNCSDSPVEHPFVLHKNTAEFVLHGAKPAGTPLTCRTGTLSPIRKYLVHIYYISTCNDCSGAGDGIPTLKLAELTPGTSACKTGPTTSCGSIAVRPIAEGIENLQLEYGLDNTGSPDGTPDVFQASPAGTDWSSVVAVKIFLMARNTERTRGYKDTKQYSLSSDGAVLADTPYNDDYKRHVYSATVRANNLAGRRG